MAAAEKGSSTLPSPPGAARLTFWIGDWNEADDVPLSGRGRPIEFAALDLVDEIDRVRRVPETPAGIGFSLRAVSG